MRCEDQFSFTGFCEDVVLRAILVTKGVSADNYGFGPAWNESGNVANDDGLAENCSIKNISNRSVGRLPHLLKVEFFNSALIGCNSSALDTNFVFQHCV